MTSIINETALAFTLKQCSTDDYFKTLDTELRNHFVIKLLTFTQIDKATMQAKRLYSSDDGNYAIGGFKPIEKNDWTTCVIEQQNAFIANKHSDLVKVFFDHALIAELGLGSVINWPIIVNNNVIGTVNLLAQEDAYLNQDLLALEKLTSWLTIPFLIQAGSKE